MKHIKSALSTIVLICLLIPATTLASAGQTWLNWNERSGLPGNNLLCLAIKKGMMAVGSDKGIGIFCENYSGWFNLADYNEKLRELPVRSMDFDSHGVLWTATPRGVISIDLNDFPDREPVVLIYDTDHGLATVDVESLQVLENRLFVGGFGGWIFAAEIQPGGFISSFRAINDGNLSSNDTHRIVSVGITALAMDYPEGGLYSTKGAGLRKASTGDSISIDALASDWINDFQAFNDGLQQKIIAVAQNKINLLKNNRVAAEISLPDEEAWINCVTIAPHTEEEGYKRPKEPGYLALEAFLPKRQLYIGTKGQGLWRFADGRWNNYTTKDSALPSDNINRVYYLPGAQKLAILSEGGLTILGISDETQFDAFASSGSAPYWAKTLWPFMQNWGPYILGYPSPKYYPITEPVSYGQMVRGKDIWLAHAKGISRFVFPSAPFTGTMQYHYQLSSRYSNDANDPTKNIAIEDSSTSSESPTILKGEFIWHHYSKEQPNDISTAPLASIMVSLDMKTIVGPGDLIATFSIAHNQPIEEIDISRASGTAIFDDGESIFDRRGETLYSVISILQECPQHPIPVGTPGQMRLDLAERPWVVFDDNRLICLDGPKTEIIPDPRTNYWHEFSPEQLPWSAFDQILAIQTVGSAIYVSAAESGVFFLTSAHTLPAAEISSSDWNRVSLPPDSEDPDLFSRIIAISRWKTSAGEYVAMLHEQGLSIFDGTTLYPMGIPKRRYTSMVADREQNLWLGAAEGLLSITKDQQISEVVDDAFNSKHVVTMAAAPDNARYPYTIAVVVADRARLLIPTDPVPNLVAGSDSIYRLRVVNTTVIGGGQIMLYDGEKWEAIPRPGVNSLMFDQSFLWVSTTCRVIRLFMPTIVQTH